MKRLFLLFIPLFLLGTRLYAGELETKSTITAVTVYRNLARETRSSTANLPAGNTEVVITGVSMNLLDPSIQVAVKGNAVLLSASVRTNYFNDESTIEANPRAVKLQDSIKALTLETRWIGEEQEVHSGELQYLSELLASATAQKEYKPTDLSACADIYRTRVMELKKKIFELVLRQERIQERLNKFHGQLNEMRPRAKNPLKEIVLNFWSDAPANIQIKSMYLVSSAGWVPMYDLNVENTNKPVAISYKAGVSQATGFEWKDVDLTISTSTPGMNNDRPILSPRYVDFISYALTPVNPSLTPITIGAPATNSMYIANRVEPTAAPMTDIPLTYEVNPDEIDIHMDYDIPMKQSIPSDAKQHICKLKNYNVPATYRYHTVPKLESAAFLLARITDYGQYNLLAGKANVFFGDTYIGQVNLNPQVTGDTLLVSLGRDENIVVKRTRIQQKTAKKVIGPLQKENFAYEITVRNNKGIPIEIEVLDQIPLSRKKEIVVSLVEKKGADYNPDYGRILWQLKIDPNKSKTLDLVYTIESPEGKVVGEQ